MAACPVVIAVLFTIAKTWKQPKCPSTDEWIKKVQYIYTMGYYSATEKNEIMPFAATWMDLEIMILSDASQTEKEKYHMISLVLESKKMIQMNLCTKDWKRISQKKSLEDVIVVTAEDNLAQGE